jgi:hypothetical protein
VALPSDAGVALQVPFPFAPWSLPVPPRSSHLWFTIWAAGALVVSVNSKRK